MTIKRKPMTVAAILGDEEDGPTEPGRDAGSKQKQDHSPGQRAHVKQLTLYLPHPIYRQLRELAFHEEKRMHTLLLEGLDRVFTDRGAPSIEQLTRTR
jgi:hypothetical protein